MSFYVSGFVGVLIINSVEVFKRKRDERAGSVAHPLTTAMEALLLQSRLPNRSRISFSNPIVRRFRTLFLNRSKRLRIESNIDEVHFYTHRKILSGAVTDRVSMFVEGIISKGFVEAVFICL